LVPKLSGAYYVVRSVVHISTSNTLRSAYYAYFHSIIKYEIIFGGVTLPTVGRFSLSKENRQIYGWCTTQNLL